MAKPTEVRVLPMELHLGDRIVDECGEWRVVGRPYTTAAGKTARVRVELRLLWDRHRDVWPRVSLLSAWRRGAGNPVARARDDPLPRTRVQCVAAAAHRLSRLCLRPSRSHRRRARIARSRARNLRRHARVAFPRAADRDVIPYQTVSPRFLALHPKRVAEFVAGDCVDWYKQLFGQTVRPNSCFLDASDVQRRGGRPRAHSRITHWRLRL